LLITPEVQEQRDYDDARIKKNKGGCRKTASLSEVIEAYFL
jgi:hypothetical protein